MSEFTEFTKAAFENYHNAPLEPAEWGFTDAVSHIVEFLDRHDSIDEMPGLRTAMMTMTARDWENWRTRYPEHVATIIDPLYQTLVKTHKT